ncbi:MAG: hypothetical protein IKU25_00225 [Clostridia bacterium]|nr:hypothetical protein [Clostridia bacterium]
MQNRLLELIQYKTNGIQADFAELMGWSPQYLNKLIREGSMGIKPITALLEKFPELNARWLLLGEGVMIDSGYDIMKSHIFRLLQLEKYMPVMAPDELRELSDGKVNFDEEVIEKWERLLSVRNEQIASRFKAAYQKQEELCKRNKA